MTSNHSLIDIAQTLGSGLDDIHFTTPSHVYNPLNYAFDGQAEYLRRYGAKKQRVLLLGMNPGPWGMAQTGVPFGNITNVRDWFKIDTKLTPLLPEQHPKYPILGMQLTRDEGSGQRLWGWAKHRFGQPEKFFEHFFIWNYCPLLFIGENRNMIPSKLTRAEQQAIEKLCDRALEDVINYLQPTALVGIGRYAQKCFARVDHMGLPIHYLLHPSPANPKANKHWEEIADHTLAAWLPDLQMRTNQAT